MSNFHDLLNYMEDAYLLMYGLVPTFGLGLVLVGLCIAVAGGNPLVAFFFAGSGLIVVGKFR